MWREPGAAFMAWGGEVFPLPAPLVPKPRTRGI